MVCIGRRKHKDEIKLAKTQTELDLTQNLNPLRKEEGPSYKYCSCHQSPLSLLTLEKHFEASPRLTCISVLL